MAPASRRRDSNFLFLRAVEVPIQFSKQQETRLRNPAARCARAMYEPFRPEKRGRRESRVPTAPAASRAKLSKAHERRRHRSTGLTRPSLRNGFNGFLRALPGDRALLSPSSRGLRFCPRPVGPTKPPQDLTPASRRQNHTTSPSASASLVCMPSIAHGKPALRSPLTLNAAASTASRSQRP